MAREFSSVGSVSKSTAVEYAECKDRSTLVRRTMLSPPRKRPANGVLDARGERLCGLEFRSGQVGGVEPGRQQGLDVRVDYG